jgi:outer membrane protein insertion porin family
MRRLPILLMLIASAGAAEAQETPVSGRCAAPDTIIFRGATRTSTASLRAESALPSGALNYRDLQRAVRGLFALGQFDDVQSVCEVSADGSSAALVFNLVERPLLGGVEVGGTDRISSGAVRGRIDLIPGRPLDPAAVARAVQRIDSLYEASGYYLARIEVDTLGDPASPTLLFRIDEGRRLAVSGIQVDGNAQVSDRAVVRGMRTRPEGFLWWRKGEFDDYEYAADLTERIPQLYAERGFIDARVTGDTVIIDRELGKALVQLRVQEGERYGIGEFEVTGARRFSGDELSYFYPFGVSTRTLRQTLTNPFRPRQTGPERFNQTLWEEATQRVQMAYANEGYIYANVQPVVERVAGTGGEPVVNLRWDIEEGQPAIVNRVEIVGNDVTVESCIRDQIFVLPGDVYNQDLLLRSYHNISNLGFFETPLPPPDTRRANEQGDIDIIFRVSEKKTGTVNFGASVGQGTGLGGFIGFEQPNLFGRCKRGALQWQFGKYINDFNLSYTDPSIQQSRISGTVTAYHTQSRFTIRDLGRSIRTGGSVQVGFPVPRSRFSRLYVSYGGEEVKYDEDGFLGSVGCRNCWRSTLGSSFERDTRIDMPFPSAGGRQTFSGQFNGGPLGGSAAFQKYQTDLRAYATLAQFGGGRPETQSIRLVTGLTTRAGAIFGNTGPFYLQKFSLGGVQFGEILRGYEEFSITPFGYQPGRSTQPGFESFGNAFFSTTAEVGIRFNQMIYLNAFYDAGNIWARPRDFDPTRLFRGAGVGASLVTPLGPLGLDMGYGFDRRDELGNPAPQWQVHFRLGQFF